MLEAATQHAPESMLQACQLSSSATAQVSGLAQRHLSSAWRLFSVSNSTLLQRTLCYVVLPGWHLRLIIAIV